MSNSGISEEHWLNSGWDVRNVLQWQRKMSLLNEYCEILISAQWLGCKRCPGHGRRNVHLGLDPSRLSCRCFQSCASHLISRQAWNWCPEGWGGSFSGLNGILIPIRWNYWHLILFMFVKSVLLCPCCVAIFVTASTFVKLHVVLARVCIFINHWHCCDSYACSKNTGSKVL